MQLEEVVSDCCKIVASQAVIEEDIWEMEFGKHQFPTKALPMGVVVTASGTGSEQNNGDLFWETTGNFCIR